VARAERVVAALPGDPEAEVLLGEALTRAGQGSAALAALRRAERAGVLSQAGLLWKARALALGGQFDELRLVFEELRGLSGGDARAIAGLELQLAALEESGHHHGKALRAYEQAARLHPSAEALRGVIRAAERLSFTDRVRTARRALCDLIPNEPGCGSR
jgi:tetratricopeptide (TPR) repeat protein